MGLFDRLFGKKEEAEKVLPSSEEVTESNEVEETVKEEPQALQLPSLLESHCPWQPPVQPTGS